MFISFKIISIRKLYKYVFLFSPDLLTVMDEITDLTIMCIFKGGGGAKTLVKECDHGTSQILFLLISANYLDFKEKGKNQFIR